ncbi:MAG TPA: uracil-DNA glycosylase [Casimicrobiaceae bacterium]|jgi:hypothetical protein|nr:uracil-DNA glycosylase [Casimicrobiaceae bacterium]
MIVAALPHRELQSGRAIPLSELASAPFITNFLRLLKKSPRGAVFNPWWQVDTDNDIDRQAPRIRRQQLRAYLSERIDKARLALIGEALSYRGGHFTGIAMTSERILLGGKTDGGIEPRHVLSGLLPRRTSKPQKNPRGFAEPTASIIWSVLLELGLPGDRFVLWNAFPWHSFDPRAGLLSNRTPTKAELAAGMPVLDAFLDLFPCECVVAVGRLAQSQLGGLSASVECVRHPASGGAALFRKQIGAIVHRLRRG